MVINRVYSKKLPEQLGLHCYAVGTHPDELVLEPLPKKNPGSAYGSGKFYLAQKLDTSLLFRVARCVL